MTTTGSFATMRKVALACAGALVGFAGVSLLFKDLLLAGTADVLWADDFDPRLIYWIVNWGYHILFEMRQPLELWNANSFFPNAMTLAYSDSLLSIQFLFAPLRLLGLPPMASLYMALAGVCLVGTTLTYSALGRIGSLWWGEKALITYGAHFCLSFSSFLFHYQLFGFQLALPFFLFLYLYLRDLRHRDLVTVAILFFAGVGFATYLAPMLFILSVLMSAPLLIKQVRNMGFRRLLAVAGIRGIGIISMLVLVLYFVQIKPYLSIAGTFPEQSFEETATYSANLKSIFTSISKFSFWYGPKEYTSYGEWEYALFPGYILLTMGAAYFCLLIAEATKQTVAKRFRHGGAGESQAPQSPQPGRTVDRQFILCMAILLASSLVLSWGPYYKPDHSVKLPFYYLSSFVLGLADVRAPGRFGIFVGLPLAVFAVAFLRRLAIPENRRKWVIVPVLGLLVIESMSQYRTVGFDIDTDGLYRRVAQQILPGTPLLELPVSGTSHMETIRIAMEQLDGSTIHWGRLVSGYGSNKTTPQYNELVQLDREIKNGSADPSEVFNFGRRYGISHYLIHVNRYSLQVAQQWRRVSAEAEGVTLLGDDNAILLNVSATPKNACNFNLDNQFSLIGYDLSPWAGPDQKTGKPGRVTLYWQAQQPISEDYVVFVHLEDSTGRIWSQSDSQPADGHYPTSRWQVGEVVRDEHTLDIPPELPSGAYTIAIGMYVLPFEHPLDVVEPTGRRQYGSLSLDKVEIAR